MPETDPRLGWPRVHASCDYFKPLRFEDEVEVHLLVEEKRSKAIRYQFRFNKRGEPPVEVARGRLTVVCVAHHADGGMKAVPIPPEIASRIDVAPPELLGQEPR
ncbi:MAG TPA: thioesterase family protein, partial [Methylomirabilota bacterium]|nr:thioesterase family protein [Methylomirabilota bacterium]